MTLSPSLKITFPLLAAILISYCMPQVNALNISVTSAITANWLAFTVRNDQPYAIVFDYPDTKVDRTKCHQQFLFLTNYTYQFYEKKIIDDSWFSQTDVDKIKDGAVKDSRRLQRTSHCTQAVCRDHYNIIAIRGCTQICWGRRRNRQLSSSTESAGQLDRDYFETKASKKGNKTMVKVVKNNLRQRSLQSTAFNPNALYLLPCLFEQCNYVKSLTNYKFQGWKDKAIEGRAEGVAKEFYNKAEKYASLECRPIFASMTYFLAPLIVNNTSV
jgi:hypothetical protein